MEMMMSIVGKVSRSVIAENPFACEPVAVPSSTGLALPPCKTGVGDKGRETKGERVEDKGEREERQKGVGDTEESQREEAKGGDTGVETQGGKKGRKKRF